MHIIDRSSNLLGALAIAVHDRLKSSQEQWPWPSLPPSALVHLSHCDRPSVESLRRVLSLSHSATVRLADRLAAEGLATREAALWDARAVALKLTRAGEQAAAVALQLRSSVLSPVLSSALSSEDQETFTRLAELILSSLTSRPTDLFKICRLCDFDACSDCPVAGALRA